MEPPTITAPWLEYLRRRAGSLENCDDVNSTSRKQLSALVAFALCFLASATTTASSSHAASSGPNASAKFQGGGIGPPKKTKPMFLFSKLKAEEDVKKVKEEAKKDPYLVSTELANGVDAGVFTAP